MNYSVSFKDDHGRTERSEFTPFDTDALAAAYGREELPGSAIVEVWKGDDLLVRLFRDPNQSIPAPTLSRSERQGVASWENEGGPVGPDRYLLPH